MSPPPMIVPTTQAATIIRKSPPPPKILGQKAKSNQSGDSNEPPIITMNTLLVVSGTGCTDNKASVISFFICMVNFSTVLFESF